MIKVGIKKEHAEAIVSTLKVREDDLATKKDIEILKIELGSKISSVESRLNMLLAINMLIFAAITANMFSSFFK